MRSEPEPPPADAPDSGEDVVRFVPERGKFKNKRLFRPPGHGRLSVCVALDRSMDDLADIGFRHVSESCYGLARTSPEVYSTLGLQVIRDDAPYAGHANVEMPVHDEALQSHMEYMLRTKSRWMRFSPPASVSTPSG